MRHRACPRIILRPLWVLLLGLLFTTPLTAAQQASPWASPAPTACVAPALPPGTPTPMEDAASPETSAAATPEEGAGEEAPFPEPTPIPDGVAADAKTEARVMAGMMNWFGCFTAGNFEAVAALSTPNLYLALLGTDNPYDFISVLPDVAAEAAGQEPIFVGEVLAYPDGRYSVENIYRNGNLVEHERFYLVEDDGYLKVDGLAFGLPVDPAYLGGEPVVIEVSLVDYAFAPSMRMVERGTPIIFRATNEGTEPHVLAIAQYPEGTTTQQLIQGDVDALSDYTASYGGHFSFPGDTFEMTLVDLEPGVYFLLCDVTTADGTPHFHLGMVAQITVE